MNPGNWIFWSNDHTERNCHIGHLIIVHNVRENNHQITLYQILINMAVNIYFLPHPPLKFLSILCSAKGQSSVRIICIVNQDSFLLVISVTQNATALINLNQFQLYVKCDYCNKSANVMFHLEF